MAQQKIQAGATIDTVTRRELDDALGAHLRSWVAETTRGGRFTRFTLQGVVAAGVIDIGGHKTQTPPGPEPGMIWDVRRLHITGLAAADVASVYVNEQAPSQIIGSTTDLPLAANRAFLWSSQVVLYPGDALKVYGTGISATGTITVSGQVYEVPVGLAWKLS